MIGSAGLDGAGWSVVAAAVAVDIVLTATLTRNTFLTANDSSMRDMISMQASESNRVLQLRVHLPHHMICVDLRSVVCFSSKMSLSLTFTSAEPNSDTASVIEVGLLVWDVCMEMLRSYKSNA